MHCQFLLTAFAAILTTANLASAETLDKYYLGGRSPFCGLYDFTWTQSGGVGLLTSRPFRNCKHLINGINLNPPPGGALKIAQDLFVAAGQKGVFSPPPVSEYGPAIQAVCTGPNPQFMNRN